MKKTSLAVGMLTVLGAASCGAGGAGDAVRPKDMTYASATGGNVVCHEVGAEGTPLVVDWKNEDRGDLEVALKQGVAVVHYDCNAIKVLPDCHVDGSYGFIGMTRKEQVIDLDNSDVVKANLPLNGASLGASLERGSSIAIGLVMVGKRTTTTLAVDKALLTGRCDGATHFVHGATVGAFSMQSRTAGSVTAVADLFGVGVSGGSKSQKAVGNKDGDLDACQKANVDAASAPDQCGAILRVQLLAIGGDAAASTTAPKDVSCPTGLVASKGACIPAEKAVQGYDCNLVSIAECTKQCDLKNAPSCSSLGLIYDLGTEGAPDPVKSAAAYDKGCSFGDSQSCVFVGINAQKGLGVPEDKDKALKFLDGACLAGNSYGCIEEGRMFYGGRWGVATPDLAKAQKLMLRACDAGSGAACGELGRMFDNGEHGATVDKMKAMQFHARACDAKDPFSCTRMGIAFENGENGLRVNKPLGARLMARGCDGFDMAGCVALGNVFAKGDGVPADPAKAKALFKKACDKKSPAGCEALKNMP